MLKIFWTYIFISTHVPRVGYDTSIGLGNGTISISTHVPRVGYDFHYQYACFGIKISTHVPRVGYDSWVGGKKLLRKISTHVPRVGYDLTAFLEIPETHKFQLTYPVWGTTWSYAYGFTDR